MKKTLGNVLEDLYSGRFHQEHHIDMNPCPTMVKFIEMCSQIEETDLEASSYWQRIVKGKRSVSSQVDQFIVDRMNSRTLSVDQFRLASILHSLDITCILDRSNGVRPREVFEWLQENIIPYLFEWRIRKGTPEFTLFVRYCLAFMRNCFFSKSAQVLKTFIQKMTRYELKNAVLYECTDHQSIRQELQNAYSLLPRLIEPVLKKWKVKIGPQIVNSLLEMHQIRTKAGSVAFKYSKHLVASQMKRVKGREWDIEIDRGCVAQVLPLPEGFDVQLKSPITHPLDNLYTAAALASIFQLEGEVYKSRHCSSFESVHDLLRYLWRSYWKWKVHENEELEKRFYDFCKAFSLLYLHSTDKDSIRQLSTRPDFEQSIFVSTSSDLLLEIGKLDKLTKSRKRSHDLSNDEAPKRCKGIPPTVLQASSVGAILQTAWKQVVDSQPFNGPIDDRDLLLMSRIRAIGPSVFPQLMEWKQVRQLDDTEDPESIRKSFLALYEKEFGRPMPKPESVLILARLACKVHLLKLDRVVYGLSGDVFHKIVRPVEFLFLRMVHWKLDGNEEFLRFTKYYLYHSLRLDSQEDIFDAKWTISESFKQAIVQKCSKKKNPTHLLCA